MYHGPTWELLAKFYIVVYVYSSLFCSLLIRVSAAGVGFADVFGLVARRSSVADMVFLIILVVLPYRSTVPTKKNVTVISC